MKKHIGVAGYGGVAAEELATFTNESLDLRLGKLPRRCYPLILSGSLSLNPFNQANYPNDGTVMVEETTLPGEFRHQVSTGPRRCRVVAGRTLTSMREFAGDARVALLAASASGCYLSRALVPRSVGHAS